MATSESRSPFRLPWSSDRSHEEVDRVEPVATATDVAVEEVEPVVSPWSDPDPAATPALPSAGWRTVPSAHEPAAADPARAWQAATPPPVPPRKPTKLMVDLAAAIRATTEAARDQALAAVEVDATEVTGAIRSASTEGVETLRRRTDEDVAAIKEWSKAEIARIREESEARTGARKATLATELAAYASAIDHRIGEVDGAVARYRADMDTYFESLAREDDPARLATMAEAMPEPLALDGWRDISDLDIAAFMTVPADEPEAVVEMAAHEAVVEPQAETVVETIEPEAVVEAEALVEAEAEAYTEAVAETVEPEAVVEAEPEAVVEAEADVEAEAEVQPEATVETTMTKPEAVVETTDPETVVEPRAAEPEAAARPNPWGVLDDAWTVRASSRVSDTEAGRDEIEVSTPAEDGDPVDRAAIMASLEAAAQAVVAEESASMPAEGSVDAGEASASDFGSGSFADRLASLLPSHVDDDAGVEPRVTQVVVTGLVSVASIASFKRHLGRLAGVQAVGVASGPGGEFVFHVTHRPDVSFRDVIPSMPGFAARVTGTSDGVVTVTARDPEAEG